MGLMGWSHSAMTGRYQHITAAVSMTSPRKSVA